MKIEFKTSRSESKAASRAIAKSQPKLSWLKAINFFGSMTWAFLITIGLITVLKRSPVVFHNEPGFIFGLCAIFLGLCIFVVLRFYVKRITLNNAGIYGTLITYELLDDRIISWKDNNVKTEIMPSAIRKVIEQSGFLLIYIAKAYAYFIPLHVFNTDTERSEFINKLEHLIEKNSC